MFEKDFVPYEESLELKQLGFDEPCGSFYDNKKELRRSLLEYPIINSKNGFHEKYGIVTTPTYSQAFRWFREKYNILTIVYANASGYLFEWEDAVGGTHRGWSEYEGPNDSGVWDTYEDAELACLKKLIQIVKQKQ
jgi:hypothetical protein